LLGNISKACLLSKKRQKDGKFMKGGEFWSSFLHKEEEFFLDTVVKFIEQTLVLNKR